MIVMIVLLVVVMGGAVTLSIVGLRNPFDADKFNSVEPDALYRRLNWGIISDP